MLHEEHAENYFQARHQNLNEQIENLEILKVNISKEIVSYVM